jgi:hypothetical protein
LCCYAIFKKKGRGMDKKLLFRKIVVGIVKPRAAEAGKLVFIGGNQHGVAEQFPADKINNVLQARGNCMGINQQHPYKQTNSQPFR